MPIESSISASTIRRLPRPWRSAAAASQPPAPPPASSSSRNVPCARSFSPSLPPPRSPRAAIPFVEQARVDTRHDAIRADTMLAVGFAPSSGQLEAGQANDLRTMVVAGQHAQRDEFVVVTDGSGGPIQAARAERVRQSLASAGARWVGTARRAGDGDGAGSGCRGPLGVSHRHARLPELQSFRAVESQRVGDGRLRMRRRLQHGPDAGAATRRRCRP